MGYFLNLGNDCIPKNRDCFLFTLFSDKDSKPDFVIHLIATVQEFKELTNRVRYLGPIGILESLEFILQTLITGWELFLLINQSINDLIIKLKVLNINPF